MTDTSFSIPPNLFRNERIGEPESTTDIDGVRFAYTLFCVAHESRELLEDFTDIFVKRLRDEVLRCAGDIVWRKTPYIERQGSAFIWRCRLVTLPDFAGQVFNETKVDLRIMDTPQKSSDAQDHQSVLIESQGLVHGDRNASYGHPLDDFTRTAKMWSAILRCEVKPEQVGLCMIAVKLSRECNKPKRDNLVDIAGYAETIEWLKHERERRAVAVDTFSEHF